MHSDLIGKIEKARQYAAEPERITITSLTAHFHGENNDHTISLNEHGWDITPAPIGGVGASPHVMALQRILDVMLLPAAREPANASMHMPSELVSKIDKARRYAAERGRVQIVTLTANFRGTNSTHRVQLTDGEQWTCDCGFFKSWGTCPHVMAVQRVLDTMLPEAARTSDVAALDPGVTTTL